MEEEDDGLTEEQRRLIAERVAALQNRFKKFEEKTTKEKIDELMLGNSDKNLTERRRRWCFECATERVREQASTSEAQDGESFLDVGEVYDSRRRCVEAPGAQLKGGQAATEKFNKRLERMRKRRSSFGFDEESDGEAEGAPEEFFETEYILEESLGVQFIATHEEECGCQALTSRRRHRALKRPRNSQDRKWIRTRAGLRRALRLGKIVKRMKTNTGRFNEPGEKQANGKWTPEEHQRFMDILASFPTARPTTNGGRLLRASRGASVTSVRIITAPS